MKKLKRASFRPGFIGKKAKKRKRKGAANNRIPSLFSNTDMEPKETKKLSNCLNREVEVAFDGGPVTSHGGVPLLRELDNHTGTCSGFAALFQDNRDQSMVAHTVEKLVKQKTYGYAFGFEDQNDHDFLKHDAGLTFGLLEHQGVEREDCEVVASRMSIQRLEHAAVPGTEDGGSKLFYNPADADDYLIDRAIRKRKKSGFRPDSVRLYIDGTFSPAWGDQEKTAFHGHYGHNGYYPQLVHWDYDLVSAKLRPGNAPAAQGTVDDLERIVPKIRKAYPGIRIELVCDAGYADPAVINWCDDNDVVFAIGLSLTEPINKIVAELSMQVKEEALAKNETVRKFMEFKYRTQNKSWQKEFRVIVKVEYLVNRHGSKLNNRAIVTSMQHGDARAVYEDDYCMRGDSENRIREYQMDLFGNRVSVHEFAANQTRLYLAALAYMLVNELRELTLRGTEFATATWGTLRRILMNIGAQVTISRRRIRFALSSGWPHQELYMKVADRIMELKSERGPPAAAC